MKATAIYFLCALILCQVVSIFSQWDWNTARGFQNSRRQGRQFNFGNNFDYEDQNANNQNQQTNNNNGNVNPANYDACFRNCQLNVVKEFNPVCASNQITYDNRRILGCAQRCGLQITEISQSTCQPSAGGK
ncbi:hypothetical protein PPYR_07995 [Photinus pyralis]|uniref:Kazal-like domain-containing protein n=1 Tax=Photinus pyralis TaxID=7054 RepID=A0A1Y1LE32_PHOPY|nr:probable WRKY transcription factor protein 1 [Photinus pyralis]XP_031338842.1 probable WRKY transcription factor protein 1 [Photinus pyralis]KAB0800115.1 hypothetical protein PPYR_07995 [Photinus pyralis]